MPEPESSSLTFEQLSVGQEWTSAQRTVARADVEAFAALSGDFNPIHLQDSFAEHSLYDQPIAHGLLGVALSSGLATQAPRVATLALVAILEWEFLIPIFYNDTIHVVTRVLQIDPKARGLRGLVTWERRLYNQHAALVQRGKTRTLVAGKRYAKPAASPATD
jgi:acyl dehydratase